MEIEVHRGFNEIGGTCIQLTHKDSSILLDIGLPLKFDSDESSIEDITPDIAGAIIGDQSPSSIEAIIISHYHMDHWGLVSQFKSEIPVYITEKAKRIIILQKTLIGIEVESHIEQAITFSPGDTLNLGEFKILTHLVDHSAMDACAFEILAGEERLVYTGDFRRHGRKGSLFNKVIREIGRPIDVLITEGTMLSRSNAEVPTEAQLEKRAAEVLRDHVGSLALAWGSAANFDRLTTFYRAAKKANRLFVVDIYTAHLMEEAAKNTSLPSPLRFDDIKVYYPPRISWKISDTNSPAKLYPFKGKKLTWREASENLGDYLIFTRPSSKSGWLEKLDNWTGSVLFYSQWSGYRELPQNAEFLNWLDERGCQDITLHTSGHADPQTLKTMIDTLKPKKIVPVHTENPEWFQDHRTIDEEQSSITRNVKIKINKGDDLCW